MSPDHVSHHEQQVDAHVSRWLDAARREDVDRAIRAVHDDIARATAERRPKCIASGRCCHFEKFGHRLYLTGIEAAWTLIRTGRELAAQDVIDAERRGDCPFLVHEQCSIHTVRPMGCRVYFCDESAGTWQSELYERSQNGIRAIHEQHDLPYEYQEWRSLLARFTMLPAGHSVRPVDEQSDPRPPFVQLRIER